MTYAKIKEQYGGITLCAIVTTLSFFFFQPTFIACKEFIKDFPKMGFFSFGFLLTLLGIIIRGDSKQIEWIKSRPVLFGRLINMNKRAVFLSIIAALYACFLTYFNLCWILDCLNLNLHADVIISFLISLFWGMLVWYVYDTYNFVHIFYLLIGAEDKSEKQNKTK